tara:strand:- start:15725 stop:16246 length:522 start_codon:yes stop_codon:yes gene_type:complete
VDSIYLVVIKRFIFFIALQGIIFNNFDLYGMYDPYICLVFILTFPTKINKITFMVLCFIFGFVLDLFSNSLGLNTIACLTVAFLRSYIMGFIFGSFYDPVGLKLIKNYISETSFSQKFLYIFSIILFHHFFLFALESLNFNYFMLTIKKILITSILSMIFCYASILIMIKNEK